ncbi:MAG TPA: glycoside hydrolase family 95 protein, partial [Cytophagales bacterium]
TRYNQADPDAYCRQTIQTAAATSVRDLYDRHLKDYQALFNRVSLHLSPGRAPDTLAQDERLARAKTGFEDPYLSELLFQYGRYLLIASSRAGDLPANLQGLWNQQMNPPWSADYHTNINLQMNYMAAEVANLPECHLPLFALMDSLAVSGRRTAQAMYGARGWVVHHLTDIFGRTTPADGVVGIWPMGSGWLARHPFEHYQFSGDKAFLAQRAYPLMKEAARFYLDFLKPIPAGLPMAGRLVTNPSHSPENAFEKADGSQYQFTYGATMDSQICHDLFTNCLAAIEALSTPARNHDPAFKKELEAALQQLVPLQISPRTGTLQEWIEDYREPEIGHRHISHLYGLYPGSQITARTPAWYQAARRTLVRRLTGNPNARTEEAKNRYQSFGSYLGGKSGGGWLSVWVSLLWLRLGEAGEAYQHHQYQLQRGLYPNFFGQAYQLDGTFGSGAVIAEMLLQSHTGTVHLLPALPPKWSAGAFTGLRARGGFTVDLAWQAGKPTTGQIYSRNDATCRLVCDQPIQVLHRGRSVPTKKTGPNEVSFATKAGQLYQIKGR